MTIPRFPTVVVSRDWSYIPDRAFTENRFAGNLNVQRAEHVEREMRKWRLPLLAATQAERAAIEAFFAANGVATKFLLKDLADKARTAITLEPVTSGGSVTRWKIPDAGLQGGDFPDDAAGTYVVRVGGSPVTVSSVDTDLREFILQTGVADTSDVDADYEYFLLSLFSALPQWTHRSALEVWSTVLEIEETGRDA